MRTPEGRDPALAGILEAHVREGLVPGWYAVNYPALAADFAAFFAWADLAGRRILDLGGRSLPYAAAARPALAWEPRAAYRRAAESLHGPVDWLADAPQQIPGDVDAVLIHLELGGLPGNPVPASLNESFRTGLAVHGYAYDDPGGAPAGQGYLDDGSWHDFGARRAWAKRLSSHMHIGAPRHRFGLLTVTELTLGYPV